MLLCHRLSSYDTVKLPAQVGEDAGGKRNLSHLSLTLNLLCSAVKIEIQQCQAMELNKFRISRWLYGIIDALRPIGRYSLNQRSRGNDSHEYPR